MVDCAVLLEPIVLSKHGASGGGGGRTPPPQYEPAGPRGRPNFQFDQAEGLVGSGANFSKAIKNKKKQPNQTPLPQGFGLKHTMGQRAVNHQRKGSIWLHIAENPHFFA
jgi:hypothetical protein